MTMAIAPSHEEREGAARCDAKAMSHAGPAAPLRAVV